MSRNRESVMVRTGTSALPRHEAWVDPTSDPAPRAEPGRGLLDRAVLFAMFALALVGVVRIGWFLLVP